MELSEKEIENFIFNDLVENGGSNLNDRGFSIPSFYQENKVIWLRQLNIDPYGIIDIVGFYRCNGEIHVDLIELKAVEVHPDHFEQIARYRKGIEVYLKNTFKKLSLRINCFLVGKEYRGLYIQNISPVSVVSFTYDISGLQFEQTSAYSDWYLIHGKDKSFRKQKTNGQKVH